MTERTENIIRKNKKTRPQSKLNPGDFGKRVFDFLIALVGLLLLSPFLGLVALWIKRDSAGPVFYRGQRAAMGGGEFGILKFNLRRANPTISSHPRAATQVSRGKAGSR